jgi:hypothetical protein
MSFQAIESEQVAIRAKCEICERRRLTVLCASCGERVCRPCAPLTKSAPPQPLCEYCREDFNEWSVRYR